MRRAERSEVEAIFRACVLDGSTTLTKKAFIVALRAEDGNADRMALRAGLDTTHARGDRFKASTPHGKENITKALRWFSSGDTTGKGCIDVGEFCTMFRLSPAEAEPPVPVLGYVDRAPAAKARSLQTAPVDAAVSMRSADSATTAAALFADNSLSPTGTAVAADANAETLRGSSSTLPTVYVPAVRAPMRGGPLPPRNIASVTSVRASTDAVHAIFGEHGRRREARRKLAVGTAPLAYTALDPGIGHGRGPPPAPRHSFVRGLEIAAPVALQEYLLTLSRTEAAPERDGLLRSHDDNVEGVGATGGGTNTGATASSSSAVRRRARLAHYTQRRSGDPASAAIVAAEAAAPSTDSRALAVAGSAFLESAFASNAAAAAVVDADVAAAAAAAAAVAAGAESNYDCETRRWHNSVPAPMTRSEAAVEEWREWAQREREHGERDERALLYEAPWARVVSFLDRPPLEDVPAPCLGAVDTHTTRDAGSEADSFLDRPPLAREDVPAPCFDGVNATASTRDAASEVERAPSPSPPPSHAPLKSPKPAQQSPSPMKPVAVPTLHARTPSASQEPPASPKSPSSPDFPPPQVAVSSRLTVSAAFPAASERGPGEDEAGDRRADGGGEGSQRSECDGRCDAMDALYRAVIAGDVLRTRWMLERNVPPNRGGGWRPSASLALPDRVSPLHIAAAQNSPAIVEALLDHGAVLEALDAFGLSPLAVAAQRNAVGALKVLLIRGANVGALTREQQLKHPGVIDAIETHARNRAAALGMARAQRHWVKRPLPARGLGRGRWAEAKVQADAVALCMVLEDVDTMTEALLRAPLRVRAVE